MRYLLLFTLFFTLCYSSVTSSKILVLMNPKQNTDYAEVVSKIMQTNINRNNKNVNLIIDIDTNEKQAINKFIKSKLDILMLHPFVYFKNKQTLNKHIKEKWVFKFSEKVKEQYYLISNTKNKDKLSEINKYKVLTIDGLDNSLIWLKYLYLKEFKKNLSDMNYTSNNRDHQIAYKVFFQKDAIGIITKSTYDLLIELNPQIKKGIKIIKKSKPIFVSFLALNSKSMNEGGNKIYQKLNKNINLLINSSEILSRRYMGISEIIEEKELKDFKNFYNEYNLLKEDIN